MGIAISATKSVYTIETDVAFRAFNNHGYDEVQIRSDRHA